MKKSSVIILGYGFGYIVISILTVLNCISLSPRDLLPLSIASFIFALAEFCDSGLKLLFLSLMQQVYRLFSAIAISDKRYIKFKKNIDPKYPKTNEKYIKRFSNSVHAAKILINFMEQKYRKLDKTSIFAILFNILAPVSLIALLAILPFKLFLTSEALINASSLFPLGLMFINVFFESEFPEMAKNFKEYMEKEVKRYETLCDEIQEIINSFEETII